MFDIKQARQKCYERYDKISDISLRAKFRKPFWRKSLTVTLSGEEFCMLIKWANEGVVAELDLLQKEVAYNELFNRYALLCKQRTEEEK